MSVSPPNGFSPAPEARTPFTGLNAHNHANNTPLLDTNNDPLNGHTHQRSASGSAANPRIATRVSSTASHQHQQEQELLSSFTVPAPPVSTKESTLAAGTDNNESAVSPESPRTLWMGDLDPWLDEHAIIGLWWQILGLQVSVKLIRPRQQRESGFAHSGYCFVEFPSFEAAQQALGLNGQLLPDIAIPSQQQFGDSPDNQKKYFRLNWASGATLSAPLVESPEFSLFVGDLSASTTEAHLLSFFQKSFPNSIRTVRVMTDPVSGKSRCFGFVRFTQESERQRALIEMNGVWFGGRPLRVATATPRSGPQQRNGINTRDPYGFTSEQPQNAPSSNLQSQGQNYYQSPMLPNSPEIQHLPHTSQIPYGANLDYVDPNNTTVFVGGLSADVSDQTLYTLFKPFGIIIQIKLPPGKNCGFVKYSARDEAEAAIANMEGFVIGGHRVRLGWGRLAAGNKRFQRQQLQMQMQAMPLGYDPSSVYASPYPPSSGHMFAPMGVQMRPPDMYHYLGDPSLSHYEDDQARSYASDLGDHHPPARSRSLDNVLEGTGSSGASGTHASRSYLHDQLASTFDTLSLDATSQHQSNEGAPHEYEPYNSYSQPAPQHSHSYSETNLASTERAGSAISGENGGEKGLGVAAASSDPSVEDESQGQEEKSK